MEIADVATLFAFLPQMVKIIPCGRGAGLPTVAKLSNDCTSRFFAYPCCVWQKGANENLNSLFREFYPNGRNLSKVVSVTLKRNLTLISAKPR